MFFPPATDEAAIDLVVEYFSLLPDGTTFAGAEGAGLPFPATPKVAAKLMKDVGNTRSEILKLLGAISSAKTDISSLLNEFFD